MILPSRDFESEPIPPPSPELEAEIIPPGQPEAEGPALELTDQDIQALNTQARQETQTATQEIKNADAWTKEYATKNKEILSPEIASQLAALEAQAQTELAAFQEETSGQREIETAISETLAEFAQRDEAEAEAELDFFINQAQAEVRGLEEIQGAIDAGVALYESERLDQVKQAIETGVKSPDLAAAINQVDQITAKDAAQMALDQVQTKAASADKRKEVIDQAVSRGDRQELEDILLLLNEAWDNGVQELTAQAPTKEERKLYRQALSGRAEITQPPTELDLILKDIWRLRQELVKLKAGPAPEAQKTPIKTEIPPLPLGAPQEKMSEEEFEVSPIVGGKKITLETQTTELPTREFSPASAATIESLTTEIPTIERPLKTKEISPTSRAETIEPERKLSPFLQVLQDEIFNRAADRLNRIDLIIKTAKPEEKPRLETQRRLIIEQGRAANLGQLPETAIRRKKQTLELQKRAIENELSAAGQRPERMLELKKAGIKLEGQLQELNSYFQARAPEQKSIKKMTLEEAREESAKLQAEMRYLKSIIGQGGNLTPEQEKRLDQVIDRQTDLLIQFWVEFRQPEERAARQEMTSKEFDRWVAEEKTKKNPPQENTRPA